MCREILILGPDKLRIRTQEYVEYKSNTLSQVFISFDSIKINGTSVLFRTQFFIELSMNYHNNIFRRVSSTPKLVSGLSIFSSVGTLQDLPSQGPSSL